MILVNKILPDGHTLQTKNNCPMNIWLTAGSAHCENFCTNYIKTDEDNNGNLKIHCKYEVPK